MSDDQSKRVRVALLYGGRSSEHDISLLSARAVLDNLDPERYEVLPIAVDRDGRWHVQDYSRLMTPQARAVPALPVDASGNRVELAAHPAKGELTGTGDRIDVVLPIMHGPLCEDGSIQGLCELADVAYVGSRVLGSAVCMDKDVAKRLVGSLGIAVTNYLVVRAESYAHADVQARLLDEVATQLGYPVFVKPSNMGSSVGVSRVLAPEHLAPALEDALTYDTKVLVEQAVDAREIEVAVLAPKTAGAPPDVSVPGEIEATGDWYSYERKYIDKDGALLHIPANLSKAQTQAAQEVARRCYLALECEGLARIDLFLERTTGRFIFNESNTMPGFTTISMYAKMWEASGVSYQELLDRLIQDAVARHGRRARLKHTR